MACALKVGLKEAQKRLDELADVIDRNYRPKKEGKFLFIPVMCDVKGAVETELEIIKRKKTVKDILKTSLRAEDIERLPVSYEIIGTILILELDERLIKKEKLIGKAYLNVPGAKTVMRKSSIHTGAFRTRGLTHLAGDETTVTIHKENGVKLYVDVAKVYFSPRSSHERKRIAELVNDHERVLVMFSGCAPYPIVIAKHSGAAEIHGIELNPSGHKLAQRNVKLNRMEDRIFLHEGDVREIAPKLGRFDRVIMPLPKTADEFLDVAIKVGKKYIHYYGFFKENEFEDTAQKLKSKGLKAERIIPCGQHKPYVYRVCFDLLRMPSQLR